MKKKISILVFPCGSEIGLEIYRSLQFSNHIKIFGGSSVDDHGKFIYKNYIPNIPFYNQENFYKSLKKIVKTYKIDAIYPAMDSVSSALAGFDIELGCKIIGSSKETNLICLSKTKTYSILQDKVSTPKIFDSIFEIDSYPVFMKPDIGYGSRGTKLVHSQTELKSHLNQYPSAIISENLPGEEYTVDCFTNKYGELLFSEPRKRVRIVNGISVNTQLVNNKKNEFIEFAENINKTIKFRGAWFFQVKKRANGSLCLLEVACRLGGSSALFRNKGVNFALLSIFDAFDIKVNLFYNDFDIVLDRALSNKFKINITFNKVYVDFDDCLVLENKIVNTKLLSLIYKAINEQKKVILITKHNGDILETLKKFRLQNTFDKIIHLKKESKKYLHIDKKQSIFIDDSHKERNEVYKNIGIPVFSPDSIESLI